MEAALQAEVSGLFALEVAGSLPEPVPAELLTFRLHNPFAVPLPSFCAEPFSLSISLARKTCIRIFYIFLAPRKKL